jgi:aryl-alcohol dehydrogenase-like predicted oxidoreductase
MACPRCRGVLAPGVVRVRRWVVAGVVLAAVVACWWIVGTAFASLAEGLEPSAVVGPGLLVPVALVLGAAAAWTLRLRRRFCAACGPRPAWLLVRAGNVAEGEAEPSRRRVLRHGLGIAGVATAGATAVLVRNRGWIDVGRSLFVDVEKTAPNPRAEWEGATIRNHRRLGRTGVLVSDISLGSSQLRSLDVAELALDRGVTYVDTAPDYVREGSEEILGRAMVGRRDRIFVASKFCTADGHLPPDTPVPRIIEAVEGSLRRLRTDRIDLLHIHSCARLERLLAPNFHEAFDRLREQGKARFLGVSSHSPNLHEVANAAIDSGRFDVLMLAYHHGMGWELDGILARAAEHDVAVVAMKTLKGAKHQNLAEFRQEAGSYSQAAFRWVLSNPRVSCLVISFSELRQVDEYLHASGTVLTTRDRAVLAKYDRLIDGRYCRPHCGECLDSCVASLPIDDVLRYAMYFEDYRSEREAMGLYARLGELNASQCIGCAAPCAGTCPHGLQIQERMLDAHRMLGPA